MFVPGNNPGMMADAHIYGPDSIMLDLEDSVTMAEKDAARLLVHNALKSIDFGGTEMVVRINPLSTLSCTDYVAEHALFTWLITHLSRDITCTDHVTAHALITWLIIL